MANITIQQPNDFMTKLNSLGSIIDDAIPEILKAGAQIFYIRLKNRTIAMIKDGTGDMAKSIKISGVKTSKAGSKYIAVDFTGKDRKGVANALKARVFEIGRNGQPGKGFGKATFLASKNEVNEVMNKKLDEIIRRHK